MSYDLRQDAVYLCVFEGQLLGVLVFLFVFVYLFLCIHMSYDLTQEAVYLCVFEGQLLRALPLILMSLGISTVITSIHSQSTELPKNASNMDCSAFEY